MSDTTKPRPETRARVSEAEADVRPVNRALGQSSAAAEHAEEGFHALENLTRRIIEQSRAAMELGMLSFARAQAPMAENGYSQSRKTIELAARIADCYREAAERSASDVQMLNACALQLFRGGQHMQHAWFNAMQQSLEHMGNKPHMLFSTRSPLEAAQVHRDLYGDMLSSMVQSTNAMLQVFAETSQEALRSLQPRPRT